MQTISLGIVSDTHGLVRPEIFQELYGVDRILHAGDVGKPEVIVDLGRIAPVTAVRGNGDRGAWAESLPRTQAVEVLPGVFLYLLHDIHSLDLDPKAAGFTAVISGHSHKAAITEKDGVLYLNPGSVGPRRFSRPVTLIRAEILDSRLVPHVITLAV